MSSSDLQLVGHRRNPSNNVPYLPIVKNLERWHSVTIKGSVFTVDQRYTNLKHIGSGAYGIVVSAIDSVTNKKVAIKKICGLFDDLIDAKRIIREMRLLRHFKHENIIELIDVMRAPNESFNDLYLVFNFMDTDMYHLIYSKSYSQLTDCHFQFLIYQVLNGLKFMHSANVIHRDLKPSNLLLNGNCDLKVIDFGLARGTKKDEEVDYQLTEYVVTRWYRAPEVMVSSHSYDEKIDVWATGCILAELLGHKPLFPGEDYLHQMNLIFDVLGTPSEEDIETIENKKARAYVASLKKRPKIPFSKMFPSANPKAIDLLEKILVFNPKKRISVQEALEHPYMQMYRVKDKEVECKTLFNFDFEKVALSRESLQQLALEELEIYRPPTQTSNHEDEMCVEPHRNFSTLASLPEMEEV